MQRSLMIVLGIFILSTGSMKSSAQVKNSKEEKWTIFWKAFTTAANNKDSKKIAELTSKDFYSGGGGTVTEWLESEVFTDHYYADFKNTLKKGARSFKREGYTAFKATGKGRSGDLFFEYKKGEWLFGGVVGD